MRKDLIETLPLPRRILDYLSNKNFLSEQIESDSSQSQVSSININRHLVGLLIDCFILGL